jgi:pimeloyl-ACP methyl ester carboxylesterase
MLPRIGDGWAAGARSCEEGGSAWAVGRLAVFDPEVPVVRHDDVRLRWHRTTLDGRTAFYGEAGDGPPVVFLHGWGLTARSYARALPTLAATGARVIAPALPGFGRSEPLPGEYTFEKLANWVDELLEHVGVEEPAALVGHSFGGAVATATAWYHPDRAPGRRPRQLGGWLGLEDRDEGRAAARRPADLGLGVAAAGRVPPSRLPPGAAGRGPRRGRQRAGQPGRRLAGRRARPDRRPARRARDARRAGAAGVDPVGGGGHGRPRGDVPRHVRGGRRAGRHRPRRRPLLVARGSRGVRRAGHQLAVGAAHPDRPHRRPRPTRAATARARARATHRWTSPRERTGHLGAGRDPGGRRPGARGRRDRRRRCGRALRRRHAPGRARRRHRRQGGRRRRLRLVPLGPGRDGRRHQPRRRPGDARRRHHPCRRRAVRPDRRRGAHPRGTGPRPDPARARGRLRPAPRAAGVHRSPGSRPRPGGRPAGAPVRPPRGRHRRRARPGAPRRRGPAGHPARGGRDRAGDDGRRTGHRVWVLHDGQLVGVSARAVLLATGGCGGLYAATTNPAHATADGLALAAGVGAALRDLEFVQFHPTGLAVPGTWRFLLTEALRGAGATLHHPEHGGRFLPGPAPGRRARPAARGRQGDPGPARGPGVARRDPPQRGGVRPGVPDGPRRCPPPRVRPRQRAGAGHAGRALPGGWVRTDLHARTSVVGLYAAGEVASTGVHGANRMAGNSLSEALVFGARAATTIADELPAADLPLGAARTATDRTSVGEQDLGALRRELRRRMLEGAGPVRDAAGSRRSRGGWPRSPPRTPAADATRSSSATPSPLPGSSSGRHGSARSPGGATTARTTRRRTRPGPVSTSSSPGRPRGSALSGRPRGPRARGR